MSYVMMWRNMKMKYMCEMKDKTIDNKNKPSNHNTM